MSTGFNTLGKIARSGKLAVDGSAQNFATLLADHLGIERNDVYFLDVLEGDGITFIYHYGNSATPPDAQTFTGSTYPDNKAEVVNNAHDLWVDGSAAGDVNFIVYVDQAVN